jgi:hypothetical protein
VELDAGKDFEKNELAKKRVDWGEAVYVLCF